MSYDVLHLTFHTFSMSHNLLLGALMLHKTLNNFFLNRNISLACRRAPSKWENSAFYFSSSHSTLQKVYAKTHCSGKSSFCEVANGTDDCLSPHLLMLPISSLVSPFSFQTLRAIVFLFFFGELLFYFVHKKYVLIVDKSLWIPLQSRMEKWDLKMNIKWDY